MTPAKRPSGTAAYLDAKRREQRQVFGILTQAEADDRCVNLFGNGFVFLNVRVADVTEVCADLYTASREYSGCVVLAVLQAASLIRDDEPSAKKGA